MKRITREVLDGLSVEAASAPRMRKNFNLHERLDDPVQRLFNAVEPGTYIRPHRHGEPSTWELIFFVRGSAVLLIFDHAGTVRERIELSGRGQVYGIEMPPDTWHTMAVLEQGSVFFEVKQGPYIPPQGAHVASWAPAEGTADAARFETWFRTAREGERPPRQP
jgi:cupin fold WbuC family metalloprotein